jgi:hypothetical protein
VVCGDKVDEIKTIDDVGDRLEEVVLFDSVAEKLERGELLDGAEFEVGVLGVVEKFCTLELGGRLALIVDTEEVMPCWEVVIELILERDAVAAALACEVDGVETTLWSSEDVVDVNIVVV